MNNRGAGSEVLVIDDLAEIVDELVTLLDLSGIAACGAASLGEAIDRLIDDASLRVIACDMRLDRESGIDLVPLIRSEPRLSGRRFEYLFITGEPTRLDLVDGMPEHRVMTKPVNPPELVAAIRRLLAKQAGAGGPAKGEDIAR